MRLIGSARRGDKTLGELTARVLRGSWRRSPPNPSIDPDELARVVPHLIATNSAGLAWRTVRRQPALADLPAGRELGEAARMAALRGAVQEQGLAEALARCAGAEVSPLVLKGWAMSRRYPERGTRSYGDLDLAFLPEQESAGRDAVMRDWDIKLYGDVDLDHAFLAADGTGLSILHSRAELVECRGQQVRVPCREDELRLACVHFLCGGGWRATSLCDVALALETRGPDFDWGRCLTDDPVRRNWMALAAGLAASVLGARLSDTPFAGAERTVPGWVVRQVRAGFGSRPADQHVPAFRTLRLREMPRAALARWPPNPLIVTVSRGARFERLPPRRLQVGHALERARRSAE